MEITCLMCNRMYERGMRPCPDCLKAGKVRYIRWDQEECDTHYLEKHPDILARITQRRAEQEQASKDYKEKRAAKNRLLKRKHPCIFWRVGQRCGNGGACEYSPTKAPKNCTRGFQAKKKLGMKP